MFTKQALRARLNAELPEPLEDVQVREKEQRAEVFRKIEGASFASNDIPDAFKPKNGIPD